MKDQADLDKKIAVTPSAYISIVFNSFISKNHPYFLQVILFYVLLNP
jgi:hypothetical protein